MRKMLIKNIGTIVSGNVENVYCFGGKYYVNSKG
jgi:hypothetical protein